MEIASLRRILENSPVPKERMQAVLQLRDLLLQGVRPDAAEEIHLTLMNDHSGEVVVATAWLFARLPAECRAQFQSWTIEKFKSAGSRSTSRGAPLLRLAYLAALAKDTAALQQMQTLRPGEMGVDRIKSLAAALSASQEEQVYDEIALSEGLVASYDPSILQLLALDGAEEFRQKVSSAVERQRKSTSAKSTPAPKPLGPIEECDQLLQAGKVAEAWARLSVLSPTEAIRMLRGFSIWTAPAELATKLQDMLKLLPLQSAFTIKRLGAAPLPALAGHQKAITALALSADGRFLASADEENQVRIWSLPDGTLQHALRCGQASTVPNFVTFAEFLPDGTLLTGSIDQVVRTWNVHTGQVVKEFKAGANAKGEFALVLSGTHLATRESDNLVHVWSLADGKAVRSFPKAKRVERLWPVAGGALVAGLSTDGPEVRVWDAVTGLHKFTGPGHYENITDLAEYGDRMATADINGGIQVWDLATGQLCHKFTEPPRQKIHGLAFLSSDRLLSVCSSRTSIWSLATGKSIATCGGMTAIGIGTVSLDPSRTLVIVRASNIAGTDEMVKLLSVHDGDRIHELPVMKPVTLSGKVADRTELFVGEKTGQLQRWNLDPPILSSVARVPMTSWTAEDLAFARRMTESSFLPLASREVIRGIVLLHELCRHFAPNAFVTAQPEAAAPLVNKPWWQFW